MAEDGAKPQITGALEGQVKELVGQLKHEWESYGTNGMLLIASDVSDQVVAKSLCELAGYMRVHTDANAYLTTPFGFSATRAVRFRKNDQL